MSQSLYACLVLSPSHLSRPPHLPGILSPHPSTRTTHLQWSLNVFPGKALCQSPTHADHQALSPILHTICQSLGRDIFVAKPWCLLSPAGNWVKGHVRVGGPRWGNPGCGRWKMGSTRVVRSPLCPDKAENKESLNHTISALMRQCR